MITLTPRAAKQVRTMHAELNAPTKRLRVLVESGGCSGFQYGMSFDEAKPGDTELESEGVPILIDAILMAESYRGVMPFLATDTVRTLLLLFFPAVSLWLVKFVR